MLALFKGELRYHEFMREMTYSEMLALRDARVKQILDEQKREAENSKNSNDFDAIQQRLRASGL